jgi:hypothetical protein
VFFNVRNWIYGTLQSELSGENYRTMLVNHEIMHLTNRDHQEWKKEGSEELCGVLNQQSAKPSPQSCRPNWYPLESDILM